MVGRLYLEHLSDADLVLLAGAGEPIRPARPGPERIEALIDSPTVFRTLFGTPGRDPLLRGSPFLLFAVLIHRVVRDLGAASFVEGWVGPRQRVPAFDMGGIFPDYAAEELVAERQRHRLERGLAAPDRERAEHRDGIWMLERLGRRAYRVAQQATDRSTAMAGVLAELSENFATARRVLNFLTDRYLFPMRQRWFGAG